MFRHSSTIARDSFLARKRTILISSHRGKGELCKEHLYSFYSV